MTKRNDKTAKKRLKAQVAAQASGPEEHYEWIKAIVSGAKLRWEYKIPGLPQGSDGYDQDVSEWSEVDIIAVTKSYLTVAADDPVEVRVEYR